VNVDSLRQILGVVDRRQIATQLTVASTVSNVHQQLHLLRKMLLC